MAEAPKYKVLIVDDDKFLLDMYSVKFSKSGIDVHTSGSGDDALSQLRGGLVPDALILDIVMPGIDGFELLEEIRKEKLVPQAIVIILTNQGQSADIERAKRMGVAGYIVKASTIPSEVLSEVLKYLKQSPASH